MHDLSDAGQAQIIVASGSTDIVRVRRVSTPEWTATHAVTSGANAGSSSVTQSVGAALTGETDAGSTVQPGLVVRHVITGR